jgi:hypothetical protein
VQSVDDFENKAYATKTLSVREMIQQARFRAKAPQLARLQEISGIVIETLSKTCTLIQCSAFWYIFDRDDKTVYSVDRKNRELRAYLNEKFGINKEHDYIVSEIEREIQFRGIEAEIHQFAFYDRHNHRLYIDRRDGEILTLDGESISVIPNGSDGVFFLTKAGSEPIRYQSVQDHFNYFGNEGLHIEAGFVTNSLILETLTAGLKFTGPLTADEQSHLLLIMIYLVFFESINPTKPLTLISGPKGSAKTSTNRGILRILLGKNSDVTKFRNDERDFSVAITNNRIVVLDNLEDRADWLMDMIAVIATGGSIKMRVLYTDGQENEVRPKTFLFLNAMNPKLRRNDIADRLLIFQLDRLDQFVSESQIQINIEKSMPMIWGELLMNLNSIIRKLKEDRPIGPGRFRLQDFENFAKRVCADPDALERVLMKMENIRGEYSLANDNLCLLLDRWLALPLIGGDGKPLKDTPKNLQREVSARELLDDFNHLVRDDRTLECFYQTANNLGRKIHEIQPELTRVFGLEVKPAKGGDPAFYRFTKRREI